MSSIASARCSGVLGPVHTNFPIGYRISICQVCQLGPRIPGTDGEKQMKAIRVHNYGGPEVLKYDDVPAPTPGKGEAIVKIAAAGLNFIDIYFRAGLSEAAQLPFTPGHEGAGTVSSVGDGVTEVRVGDRVAYAMTQGSYAEYAAVPSWR